MEIFLNDQSLHGQYVDRSAFQESLDQIMAMRALAKRFDRDVHCHWAILTRDVLRGVSLQRVVGGLPRDQQRAVMWWLTRGGPFWWSDRRHGGDDYLESEGDLVTESAIAEAAFRIRHDVECSLMSFTPSDWNQSPVEVTWRREAEGFDDESVAVENFWTVDNLEERLARAMAPIQSWGQLQHVSERHFSRLTFGEECFGPLSALPFRGSAAARILALLRILDRFADAFNADGSRSREGHRIYRDHFTGENAVFSDSSLTEKREFGQRLRFPHPDEPDEVLPCTWHGKVRAMTLRMHFSWPVRYGQPVYVMYIGQKITRR
ncbi:MAG: hypothetical protein OXE73_05895 [Gammaproteobacteria bacterium]|nr:hypothetical protein [Gammaproteobacteria bacterium]